MLCSLTEFQMPPVFSINTKTVHLTKASLRLGQRNWCSGKMFLGLTNLSFLVGSLMLGESYYCGWSGLNPYSTGNVHLVCHHTKRVWTILCLQLCGNNLVKGIIFVPAWQQGSESSDYNPTKHLWNEPLLKMHNKCWRFPQEWKLLFAAVEEPTSQQCNESRGTGLWGENQLHSSLPQTPCPELYITGTCHSQSNTQ